MVDPTLILNDLYVIMCVYKDRSRGRRTGEEFRMMMMIVSIFFASSFAFQLEKRSLHFMGVSLFQEKKMKLNDKKFSTTHPSAHAHMGTHSGKRFCLTRHRNSFSNEYMALFRYLLLFLLLDINGEKNHPRKLSIRKNCANMDMVMALREWWRFQRFYQHLHRITEHSIYLYQINHIKWLI